MESTIDKLIERRGEKTPGVKYPGERQTPSPAAPAPIPAPPPPPTVAQRLAANSASDKAAALACYRLLLKKNYEAGKLTDAEVGELDAAMRAGGISRSHYEYFEDLLSQLPTKAAEAEKNKSARVELLAAREALTSFEKGELAEVLKKQIGLQKRIERAAMDFHVTSTAPNTLVSLQNKIAEILGE